MRMILVSVGILGLVTYFIFRWQNLVEEAQPPLTTRVDIYPDRITYRNGTYATPSALAIGLKANNEPPEVIEIHGCDAVSRLAAVLDVVRAEYGSDFEVVLPQDC